MKIASMLAAGQYACGGAASIIAYHKSKLTPHQKREAIARRERSNETLAEIGRSYNVSG